MQPKAEKEERPVRRRPAAALRPAENPAKPAYPAKTAHPAGAPGPAPGRRDPLLMVLLILAVLLLLAVLIVAFILPLTGGYSLRNKEQKPQLDLNGRRWVSYGDSITDHGYYQAAVIEHFSLLHFDHGLSGTCVAGRGPNPFWSKDRLDSIIADAPDLITILGGTNDYYADVPLGDDAEFSKALADKSIDTFLGAYATVVETLQAALPDTEIVIISTPPMARQFAPDPQNGSGLRPPDYSFACAQVASHYGLRLVDLQRALAYGDQASLLADFSDGIHPNASGAAKIAEAIIAALEA